ncbi:MAG TPA: sigma-70 family RNA polymerase sigma factor [Stenotrophomonas sp.]|nr:sigma-70 family RNA polymerase sigma factor [Stenotrophomonas sp.]
MTAEALDQMLQRELPTAAAGCQQAYGRIVQACQNTVTAIALAITRDVGASEDIAQEAFLRAWQQLARLNNPTSFLPWLRQITRNLARDWLRAQRHRPLSGEAAELAIGMAADPGLSPAEQWQRVEEEIAAEELISALPPESRETLLLYYREGQRSQQVAQLLGLSDAAVRKRLSRARALVREQMLARFGQFARDSAPGAAFAAAVVSAAMIIAPGVAGTTIAAATLGAGLGTAGSASKIGGGLGVSALSGGTALGSLGAAMLARADAVPTQAWLIVTGALLVGFATTYASGFYLLSYAGNDLERTQLRRLIRQMMLAATACAMSTLVLSLAGAGMGWILGGLAAGMCVVNYQCLVTLPRVMRPLLARDMARSGRQRPSWIYQSTFGRPAVIWSNVFVLGCALWSLHVS